MCDDINNNIDYIGIFKNRMIHKYNAELHLTYMRK